MSARDKRRKHGKSKWLNNYMKQRSCIGKGTFGEVSMHKHIPTQNQVAIKRMAMSQFVDPKFRERLNREVNNMKKLNHPNIVHLFDYHEETENCYFILELATQGELFDYIKNKRRVPENQARLLFQQIVGGIEYCHREGVVHRDLKPENILLDEHGMIKICDFGLSNVIAPGELLGSAVGSPNYAAPELLSGFMYFGPEVDIWSTGCILFTMLFGELPFSSANRMTLYHRIRNGKYRIPKGVASESACHLVKRMITVNPAERIGISGIRKHAWFRKNLPRYLQRPYRKNPLTEVINDESFKRTCRHYSMSPYQKDSTSLKDWIIKRTEGENEMATTYHMFEKERYMEIVRRFYNEDVKNFRIRPIIDERMSKTDMIHRQMEENNKNQKMVDNRLDEMLANIDGSSTNVEEVKERKQVVGDAGWKLGEVMLIQAPMQPDEVFENFYDILTEMNMRWMVPLRNSPDHKDCAYHIVFTDPKSKDPQFPHTGLRLRKFKREPNDPNSEYDLIVMPYYYSGDVWKMYTLVRIVLKTFAERIGVVTSLIPFPSAKRNMRENYRNSTGSKRGSQKGGNRRSGYY